MTLRIRRPSVVRTEDDSLEAGAHLGRHALLPL